MNVPKTNPQVKKIYACARELGLDDDLLHAVVGYLTGVDSIAALNKIQAGIIIDELEKRKSRENRPGMASKKQLWLIRQLEKELGWADEPNRLRGFLKKYAKVEDIHWLDPKKAYHIIEGLKKIRDRQKKQGGIVNECH